METIRAEIAAWEAENLTPLGYFTGSVYAGCGLRWGEYVPVDARYSAMASHRWAARALEMVRL